MALNLMKYPCKKHLGYLRDKRGEGQVKTETETEVMQPQAKEHQQLTEAERGKEQNFL